MSVSQERKPVANPWFRLYGEFRHDPKIRTMSDALQIRLVRLFCLRSEGKTEELREDELCFGLGCSASELEETKSCFVGKGFINESWAVLHWDKRQFSGQKSSLPTGGPRSRGYVYYVADKSNFVVGTSLIKIGFSSNPWARIKELRTALPNLEILGVEQGDFDLEVSIHERFKSLRKDGEWFVSGKELVDYVAKLRSGYDPEPTVATNRTEQNRTKQNRVKTFAQAELERVYEVYPRKVGKGAALKAIEKALKRIAPLGVDWLVERTHQYALSREFEDPQYTPHPQTWFNQERYNDGNYGDGSDQEGFEGNGGIASGKNGSGILGEIFDATCGGAYPGRDSGSGKIV